MAIVAFDIIARSHAPWERVYSNLILARSDRRRAMVPVGNDPAQFIVRTAGGDAKGMLRVTCQFSGGNGYPAKKAFAQLFFDVQ